MIFISYRRNDTGGHAGRILDRLVRRFGGDAVFRDVDTIAAGEDFRVAIGARIAASRVLLALIGPRWLATEADGRRRLFDADDLVRIEIATALERGLRVVPVLLHGAAMPSASELPRDLAPLASRHAIEVRDASFESDVERLAEMIERDAKRSPGAAARRKLTCLAVLVVVAAALGFAGYYQVALSPGSAREALARKGIAFDPATFVERAGVGDAETVALFLRAGMQPDAGDRNRNTALMSAAANGHLAVAKQLVAKGADASAALPWAVLHPDMLDFLLASRPSQDALDAALMSAARDGTEAIARLLDAGADVNANRSGATPLTEAARLLNVSGARLLLARGARTDPEIENGWLPLHHAIDANNVSEGKRESERLALVQMLVERGAALEARTRSMGSWQPTPLLLAIDKRLPAVARYLLEHGANVEARTLDPAHRERTALMWAAEKGLPDVVEALLARGAAVDARNGAGETALIVAAGGTVDFGRKQPAVVRLLLAAGAEVNAVTKRGASALMRAATGNSDVVAVLLEHGAEVDTRTPNGWTALMAAAEFDNAEAIELLLGRGADPKLKNAEGDDALAIAVQEKSRRAAEALRKYVASATPR